MSARLARTADGWWVVTPAGLVRLDLPGRHHRRAARRPGGPGRGHRGRNELHVRLLDGSKRDDADLAATCSRPLCSTASFR